MDMALLPGPCVMGHPVDVSQIGLSTVLGNVFAGQRGTLMTECSGLKYEVNKSLLNTV